MKQYHLFAILLIVLLYSCQTGSDDIPPNPNDSIPIITPVTPSSPTVTTDGIIFTNDSANRICAFDIRTEKKLWTSNYTSNIIHAIYDDGVIYAGSFNAVCAIDAATGQSLWRTTSPSLNFYNSLRDESRPVVQDSLLYSIMASPLEPQLFCIEKRTGRVVWKKPLTFAPNVESRYSTPVIAGSKVIGAGYQPLQYGNNILTGYNRFTGEYLWTEGSIRNAISGFPFAPDTNYIIIPASYGGNGLYCIDANTGKISWSHPALPIHPHQSTHVQKNTMVLIDAQSTNTSVFEIAARSISNGVSSERMLQATASADTIFSVTIGYRLICRKASATQEIWSRNLPTRTIFDSLLLTSFTRWSDVITSPPSTDGEIICIYENLREGTKRIYNSLNIYSASTGNLIKEIKFNTALPQLGKNLMLFRNGKTYHPTIGFHF
jgi:hypothetical protein